MRRLSALAGLAALLAAAAPAAAASFDVAAANRGLADLKAYNLIVFNDLTTSQETEGKTFVGGNLNINGGYQSYLKGPAGKSTASSFGLTVGKDVTGGALHMENRSGGQVGGSLKNGSTDFNGGDATLNLGGTGTVTNQNGSVVNRNVAGLAASIADQRSALVSDLTNLSAGLTTLAATDTLVNPNNGALVFSVAKANADLAVFSISDLSIFDNKRIEYALNGAKNVIINVTGTSISIPGGANFSAASGAGATVLWNFANATSLDLGSKVFYGSVLATNVTSMSTGNFIEGAVAVNAFTAMNGEVHLPNAAAGTSYAGTYTFATSAVPEPASWAMMIAGFGLLGTALRRRPRTNGIAHIA